MRPAQTVASREIDLDRRDLDLIKAVLLESEVDMVDGEGDMILVIRLFRAVLCSLCVERAAPLRDDSAQCKTLELKIM
jgi:hypothetical protein